MGGFFLSVFVRVKRYGTNIGIRKAHGMMTMVMVRESLTFIFMVLQ